MTNEPPEPRCHLYRDIQVGMQQQRDYVISTEVYEAFLDAFDDRSPIHVDEAYAKTCGFSNKVMHGALLNGFLSHFVGMHFPGRLSMLIATDVRFAHPCYLGDAICIQVTVKQKMDARKIIVLDALFTNVTRLVPAARGRIQIMMRDGS